jgi:hypothetical protein
MLPVSLTRFAADDPCEAWLGLLLYDQLRAT